MGMRAKAAELPLQSQMMLFSVSIRIVWADVVHILGHKCLVDRDAGGGLRERNEHTALERHGRGTL